MAEPTARNYDVKAVTRSQSDGYQSFGWVCSKEPVPEDMTFKSKEPLVLMKRKLAFGSNPELSSCESSYEKLLKKKYRAKPILGIISFILMLAFIAVAGLELYFGVTKGVKLMKENKDAVVEDLNEDEEEIADNASSEDEEEEEEVDEEASDEEQKKGNAVTDILDKVHDEYLSKVTSFLDGKESESGEYTPGIADNLGASLGAPIKYFVSADTLVGVVALILAIVFIILFAKVAGIKKKRRQKEAKMEDLRDQAEEIVMEMKRRDIRLMGKLQRKQYMWESIITNALINANGSDNDDDYYD